MKQLFSFFLSICSQCRVLNFLAARHTTIVCLDTPKPTIIINWALRFVFTQIIVLLIYRCNEGDIRQTSALPLQKNTYRSDTKANLYRYNFVLCLIIINFVKRLSCTKGQSCKHTPHKHIHTVTQDITKTMKLLGLQGQNNRIVQKTK